MRTKCPYADGNVRRQTYCASPSLAASASCKYKKGCPPICIACWILVILILRLRIVIRLLYVENAFGLTWMGVTVAVGVVLVAVESQAATRARSWGVNGEGVR